MHIEESQIELFIFSPESLTKERKSEIQSHLEECIYCKEVFETFKKVYVEIDTELKKNPSENDVEIAGRIKSKLQRKKGQKLLVQDSNAVGIYDGRVEIIEKPKNFSLQNIFYFIKKYPTPSFGFAVIASLAIAFIVSQVKAPIINDNPFTVNINNNTLEILNSHGELLWTKPTIGIHKRGIDSLTNWLYGDQKCIGFLDIDSDGKNEVLIAGNEGENGFFNHDSLYCFNNDGSSRWVISGDIGKSKSTPKWKIMKSWIRDFFTIKVRDLNKLFMISNDRMYGGAVLSELNPKNGEILSSIFHAGWFSAQEHLDLDGDGHEEIILGGTSSDYQRPFLLVIKYGTAEGVIPRSVTHKEDNEIKTNPLYYILFPISELGKVESKSTDNDVTNIQKTKNDEILIGTSDIKTDWYKHAGFLYALDKNMKVQSIIATNNYEQVYENLRRTGKIKQHLDSTFYKTLTDSVKYWEGDKFVNYPVKNKYWNERNTQP